MSTSQGCKGFQRPPEARREAGTNSSSEQPEATNPADSLILGFRFPELWLNTFLLCKAVCNTL